MLQLFSLRGLRARWQRALARRHPGRTTHRASPRAKPALEQLEDRTVPSGASLAGYGQLPLSFEANVGQADAAVRYLAHGPGYALALTDTGAVLDLHQASAGGLEAPAGRRARAAPWSVKARA